MWCVASAPIVPLARDLDAALGMSQIGRPAHFHTPSAPLLTAPLPLRRTRVSSASCPRHSSPPHSPLGLHPRFFHTPPTPLRLSRTCLRAFPHLRHVPPRSTPLPPRRHRSDGDLLPKTQKNEHRSLGSGARFGLLSGRKRPVFLMFQKPQPKKTERTSCAKRMRMNMARG